MSYSYQLKSHPNRLLLGHLYSVAKLSSKNMSIIYPQLNINIKRGDITRASYITGASHDIGKGTAFFQCYLNGEYNGDPILKSHSMISSLYSLWTILNEDKITEANKEFLALSSALAIQGHHNSLKRPTTYLKRLDVFDDRRIFSPTNILISKHG
jgi:CRISPR-associated endonuclease Cas3-HD